jgi:MATE family multidrug resistance protein
VQPVTAVSCAAVALAPIYNYLLIFKLGFGLDGAAYAMVLAHASMLLMLSAYLVWRERQRLGTPEQTWHGWWVALRCAALCCAGWAAFPVCWHGRACGLLQGRQLQV